MAKFSLKLTKRYLRDLKLARKRGMDENLLNERQLDLKGAIE